MLLSIIDFEKSCKIHEGLGSLRRDTVIRLLNPNKFILRAEFFVIDYYGKEILIDTIFKEQDRANKKA
jgi:hypothetical protein